MSNHLLVSKKYYIGVDQRTDCQKSQTELSKMDWTYPRASSDVICKQHASEEYSCHQSNLSVQPKLVTVVFSGHIHLFYGRWGDVFYGNGETVDNLDFSLAR